MREASHGGPMSVAAMERAVAVDIADTVAAPEWGASLRGDPTARQVPLAQPAAPQLSCTVCRAHTYRFITYSSPPRSTRNTEALFPSCNPRSMPACPLALWPPRSLTSLRWPSWPSMTRAWRGATSPRCWPAWDAGTRRVSRRPRPGADGALSSRRVF